ncbi:uncharacterized protein LOC129582980 [Paramacrobiotus metropolitanus]|uniref:uncharacterized protein LOC129582980 n=1 Tax=Paramacrobiotus metropolitanus TaxID=2943436 RepID=UPI00244620B3|nr:uncharacterized protein LOC129582980 [Paramacrobiotus metropolitanus]
MSAIEANAFSALGERSGSAVPELNALSINANNITTLDWSAFQPLMGSVKMIDLYNNNIQRIFLSRAYEVHGLQTINLINNFNLSDVDDRFLHSVSPHTGRPKLYMTQTPLCSSPTLCQRILSIHGPLGGGCCEKVTDADNRSSRKRE